MARTMTLEAFWDHIEEARRSSTGIADMPTVLARRLSELPEDEIIDFSSHFHACIDRANDGCLWVAACMIMRGCSDDAFDYFMGWLIAQGRKVFEAALAEPDSLAELENIEGTGEVPQLEAILSVDVDAFQQRTGLDDFEVLRKRPRSGTRNRDFLRLSDNERREFFPKLAAKFSGPHHASDTGRTQ